MSLLIDALKRAEEAKRQRSSETRKLDDDSPSRAGSGRLSLEPVAGYFFPELSDPLAAVGVELHETHETHEPSSGVPRSQDQARQVKPPPAATAVSPQPAARNARLAKPPRAWARYRNLFIAGGAGVVLATAVAADFYVRLNSVSESGLRPAGVLSGIPPNTTLPAPTPPNVPPPPAPETALVASPAPPSRIAAAPRASEAFIAAGSHPPTAAIAPVAIEPSPRITTSTPPPTPGVDEGHRSLQAGDMSSARSAYEAALKTDPHNGDALLGLATIAVHEGDNERADGLYWRTLESDPKNAAAQAALVGMHAPADLTQAESRLKGLLAVQSPETALSGVVQFALGNIYARQRRWNEAQSAYFQAYAADAGNPDYHFNLAISLDHLGQKKLAADFYRSAMNVATTRIARFDHRQAQLRLRELEP